RSVFHAPSRKFKILVIPNILGYGKSYEHDFVKKCDGHKLCAKSSFDWFFLLHLKNSKTGLSQNISPREVVQARFREKTRLS
ncbi:hypothetical protein B296_00035788, partial [Ensete ventricosum]